MKKILVLLALTISVISYSQEKGFDDADIDEDPKTTSFEVIEHVPVYKGCDASLSNAELKKCMSDAIVKLVVKNFNKKITNGLGLPDGYVRINVIFKIDREGNIKDIRSRAPHPALEEESIRVIELIPQMDKPGYQRGKPVTVPYALPIVFNIQNPKKSSRNQRK